MLRIVTFIAFAVLLPPSLRAAPGLGDVLSHQSRAFAGTLRLDPAAGTVTGDLQVDLVVAVGPRTDLYFVANLPVVAARDADGTPLPVAMLTWNQGPLARVTLPSPAADGDPRVLTLFVAGAPQCDSGLAIGWSLCALGDVAWMDLGRVLPTSVAGDPATLDLAVEVPADRTVVSSGRVVAVTDAPGGFRSHRVVQDFPTRLHGLATANYQVSTVVGPTSTVSVATLPDPSVEASIGAALAQAVSALAFFSAAFGPAPFPALVLAQFPDSGAAYSLPGLILLPRGVWTGEGGGTMTPADLVELVLPHEIAHQWFTLAMQVSPLAGAWLAEGFAEYAAVEFLGSEQGDAAARDLRRRLATDYRRRVKPGDDFVLAGAQVRQATDRDTWFRVTYGKGALVVRTLRAMVGDVAFGQALQALYAATVDPPAFWEQDILRKRLEEASGKDLGGVFAAWLSGRGYPVLTVGVSGGQPGAGPARAHVLRSSSTAGVTFDVPVTFRLTTTDGVFDRAQDVVADDATFAWDVPGRLLQVEVDPDVTFVARVSPGLPGDTDLSGEVDAVDLVRVAWALGTAYPSAGWLDAADLDDSGAVDAADLAIVLANFGRVGE